MGRAPCGASRSSALPPFWSRSLLCLLSPACHPSTGTISRPSTQQSPHGLQAVASGWGKPTDSSDSISPTLRWVETDTISNTACWIEFPSAVNKNVICISGAHGKSTCNGDSGGPLYLHNHSGSIDSEIQPYKQIGITSFGSSLAVRLASM